MAIKKIMVIASMLVMTATLNAQNLMEKVANDGRKSIGNITMAKAQAWRTEEYQNVGTSNLTSHKAVSQDGMPYEVILVKESKVYGPLQAVYKDGLSVAVTAGAAYGLGMGKPELLNSVQPTVGISLQGDGLGWASVKTHLETVREVYGYALGTTILEDVEPWELDENEPTIIYYQMVEGKYVIWFKKPEDPSYEPKTGRLLTRQAKKEVSEVKQHRPFGAELNVSATIRPYELDSAKPNTAYFSFKTTLYLKYRLFEDKWQRNRLNLYGSVGYIHGKDSEQYDGEDGPRPYTGSGLTYGGGLEYRFQFPMRIKKNGQANYFWAGSALNLKVGMERNPIVRPGNTFDRWMVVSTISLSFGTSRKVAQ